MNKKLIAITLLALSLVLVNCKDKTTDDPEPAKTLNKSLLPDKYWEGTQISHYFRSDGAYCNEDGTMEFGTWKWLNNSDSLEIDEPKLGFKYVWYVKYCTETEMSARNGNDSYMVFTKK